MAFARAGRMTTGHASSEAVTRGLVTTLTVAPSTANVAQSATQQYTVTGVGPFGAAIPLPSGSIAWTVSDPDAGTISATGLLTAGTDGGTYQVRATHTASAAYDEADAVVAP